MQAQLEEMSRQMKKEKNKQQKPVESRTTPAPKPSRVGPTSRSAPALSSTPSSEPGDDVSGDESVEGGMSLAAKKNRLRRLCERKPSGKIQVPESIHELWKKAGHSRELLLQELEDANWDKDWNME